MVKSSRLLFFFLVCSVPSLWAQQNRYMVFFTDKDNSAYSIDQPLAYLSQRALDRRVKNSVNVTEQDLPVNATYIDAVRQAGATVFHKSKWFNAILVQCDVGLIATLEALPIVDRVELAAPGQVNTGRRATNFLSNRTPSSARVKTTAQLSMLGLDVLHQLNLKGEGVKIAVFDSGFPGVNQTAAFAHLQDNIIDTYNFVNNQSEVFVNDDHGTEVLSVMAGFVEGSFAGGAYNSDYHLYVTEEVPSEYRIEEYNWLFAAERADSAGVDVINASLGYNLFDNATMNYAKSQLNGETAVVTRAAELAADRGVVVVVSAGNEGNNSWQLITPPADAVGVIAVGSVTSSGNRSPFSSVGPTSDNRIKPDLSAMGSGVFVIRESGNTGTSSGTSVASPLLASLVAGIIQRYDTLSREEIINALKETASKADSPDNLLGYGIPNFISVRELLDVAVIENPDPSSRFDVYPNPADSGFIYVRPKKVLDKKLVFLEVVDTRGKTVKRIEFPLAFQSDITTIDLTGISAGILLIRITADNQTDIFKIVKAR